MVAYPYLDCDFFCREALGDCGLSVHDGLYVDWRCGVVGFEFAGLRHIADAILETVACTERVIYVQST